MHMKLYNTLTKKKQVCKPLKKGVVSLYTCGPTVYNYAHIGNLRTYIFADVLERSLRYEGFRVKRVMNITDVGHLTGDVDYGEDKVEQEAKKEKKTVWQIAEYYTKAFFDDAAELNIKKPATVVRATEAIAEQIKLIERLVKKGYAYETEQAVYFDVAQFKAYGKLSGQSLSEKLITSRGEVVEDSNKHNPADFAVWFKRVGRHANHVMHWPAPWGDGFPGWHIECSAISAKQLGQPFDIHTGGVDHIGTHHENEIAQSQAAYGKPLANIWMHGEFLVMDKQKMAKSKGSFVTLSAIKNKGFDPLAYRYLALTSHYRSQLSFSFASLTAAQTAYHNLLEEIARPRIISKHKKTNTYQKRFNLHVSDDLGTPQALAVLWEAVKDPGLSRALLLAFVKQVDMVFGLDLLNRAKKIAKEQGNIPAEVKKLGKERFAFRKANSFDKADKIRLRLVKLGYEIKDQEQGFEIKKIVK
ncbi:MAG: cysteine--tRNA ligase [Parcubacteria group bacterium CG10_big_fil_rev_8_21_14_0_10_46_32]|nr:MAG: cysteine--tRNA ligase [Parcubacteria group bacterium CG10_big_fil_rev_8_21_14_0_10_46_32]